MQTRQYISISNARQCKQSSQKTFILEVFEAISPWHVVYEEEQDEFRENSEQVIVEQHSKIGKKV